MQIDRWSLNHVYSSQLILWLLNIYMRYYNYYNDRSKQNFDLKNQPGPAGAYVERPYDASFVYITIGK